MRTKVKIIIIFLFLIIIVEGLIYVFYIRGNGMTIDLSGMQNTSLISPTPNLPLTTPSPTFTPALNSAQLEWFKQTRQLGHISSELVQEYEGTVHSMVPLNLSTQEDPEMGYRLLLTDNGIIDEFQ